MIDLATTTKQFLRIDEIMEVFGVGRTTVNNWRRAGKLHWVPIGGQIRIPIDAARNLAAGRLNLVRHPPNAGNGDHPQPPAL